MKKYHVALSFSAGWDGTVDAVSEGDAEKQAESQARHDLGANSDFYSSVDVLELADGETEEED